MLQSLRLLVGRQEITGTRAAVEGAVMGWDAALAISHAALVHMAIADAARESADVQKFSWSVLAQIDDVLARAGHIGDNQPDSLLGSLCKFGVVADPRKAVDLVMKKLQDEYYPRIGAVISSSKTVQRGQDYHG
eukprot:1361313-Amphidinium_carterae.1